MLSIESSAFSLKLEEKEPFSRKVRRFSLLGDDTFGRKDNFSVRDHVVKQKFVDISQEVKRRNPCVMFLN